jgi:radical SAM protein with 4Fe4S-binding SPASM domain
MILAYMKPTNYCNVGCTHCYLPESIRAHKELMNMNTLEDSVKLLGDMQNRMGLKKKDEVNLLWHGGEPLTVPLEWYEEAGEIMDKYIPDRMESIQTSLIPLKKEYIPFIQKRLDYQIGSSIDFSQRQIKGSVENFHSLWMKKVDLARDNGILVIPGAVPTRNELGRERFIVEWFMDRHFPMFNIDRYNSYANAFDDRPSNLEHSYFLISLFDVLMEKMDTHGWAPVIGAITGCITGVLFEQGGDRWGGTCQSDFVVVEPDGGLNTCPDKSTLEDPYSYAHEGWKAFAASKFRRKWIRHQNLSHKMPHCEVCENQTWCQSGCPITPNGKPMGEDECSGYKTFITHVRRFSQTEEGKVKLFKYLEQMSNDPWIATGLTYGGSDMLESINRNKELEEI